MRLPSIRFLIGLVTVIAVCAGVAILWTRSRAADGAGASTVVCVGGSEKSELMADQRVKDILRDEHGIEVSFAPRGSYDQAQLTTEELRTRKVNCLWPSSASAQSVFESAHVGAFPGYRAETVLQSPEVVYAGPRGTDALVAAGLVQQRDQRYFITGFKSLLLDHVLKGRTWESLGASDLRGPVTIASTDPARSNSGFTLAQLQLNVIATDDAYRAPSLAQAKASLPTMRALHDSQGLQAGGSDAGFRQWLTQGAEFKAPLYAGYESQLVQLAGGAGKPSESLLENVRVLYPEPTIYSDHPILALDEKAGRFLDAMKDPKIQEIAWRTFGFRSAVQVGASNVTDFPALPLAETVRTTAPPAADVTLALLACMRDANACH